MNHLRDHLQNSQVMNSEASEAQLQVKLIVYSEIQVKSAFGKRCRRQVLWWSLHSGKYTAGYCYSSSVIMGSRCDEEVAVRRCLRISQ